MKIEKLSVEFAKSAEYAKYAAEYAAKFRVDCYDKAVSRETSNEN